MAFLSIKSTCFLLIITIAFSYSFGGVEAQFGEFAKGLVKGATNIGKKIGAEVDNVRSPQYVKNVAPATNNVVLPQVAELRLQYLVAAALKTEGEKLAGKIFGPAGKTGFRWGWNGSKYYIKVANKCEEYVGNLNNSCPKQSLTAYNVPLPSPDCVAQCVIKFANLSVFGTPLACTSHNVASCPDEVEEAECDPRPIFTQKSCTFIKV